MKDLLFIDGEPVELITEGEALLLHAHAVAQQIEQRVREAVGATGAATPEGLAEGAVSPQQGGPQGAEV
jgi:hypothetical protein